MSRAAPVDPGLCPGCVHTRRVVSGRGSVFWMCGAPEAAHKYPPLPVLRCADYRELDAAEPELGPLSHVDQER